MNNIHEFAIPTLQAIQSLAFVKAWSCRVESSYWEKSNFLIKILNWLIDLRTSWDQFSGQRMKVTTAVTADMCT